MIEKLRKKYMVSCIIGAVILLLIAFLFSLIFSSDIVSLFKKPVNLSELKAEDIKEGLKVEGDVDFVWDSYAYTEKNNKMIEGEYLIPIGDEKYIGMVCRGNTMDTAEKNMNLFWDYMYSDDAELTIDDLETFHIKGTIKKLSGESYTFFNEYISEYDSEDAEYFLPYAIYVGAAAGNNLALVIIVDALLIIVAVCILVSGLRGSNVKSVEEYCKKKGNKEYTLSRIEEFYNKSEPVQGIRADGEYFMAIRGKKVFMADSDECVWVYQHVIQHRTNFIPTGKTFSLIMKKSDGKAITIPMKNKKSCEEAINYIAESMPYLFIGYSDELNAAYSKQLNEMVKAVADRKHQFDGCTTEM